MPDPHSRQRQHLGTDLLSTPLLDLDLDLDLDSFQQ